MSNYNSIFRVRSLLDAVRQPALEPFLSELVGILSGSTPYERTSEVRNVLMAYEHFSKGARGRCVYPSAEGFFYRVSSLYRVREFTTWRDESSTNMKEALGKLIERSREAISGGGWFPLSDVALGSLTSERSFTWWSTYPVCVESVICDLHNRGMPNDWVSPYSLILRCSAEKLQGLDLIYEPSVMDGFDSVIFQASDQTLNASCGSAISIEDAPALRLGADEYAVKPLPVEIVDIYPVEIDDTMRGHKVFEKDLHEPLLKFYEGQLG